MSVTSSVEESIKPNGVDTYDSGDDWEIGVGNLITDLDADLEKDREKLKMNRILSIKSTVQGCEDLAYNCANASAVLDGLTCPSVQPSVARGNFNKDSKKFRVKKRNSSNDSDKFPSLDTLCGIPKVCVGKRREAQGRPREAFEMNSAPDQTNSNPDTSDVTVSCAKGKEGKKGKNQSKSLKREKDSVRTRRDKQSDGPVSFEFGPVPENGCAFGGKENPCYCGDNGMGDINRGGMDAGMRGSAIVVEKTDDTCTPDHIQKTLNIKTRSIGTNTQEAERAIESAYMEPCQPGTSVNLEGVVWHETEEGVLVVNVTWRKRTYVGTLLDSTKHDWAPPRFCESPISDPDMPGGGRGRGKRMRLTIPDPPLAEPALSKVRGLSHKRRGVGIGNKGRRGSLNLSNCRTNPFYSVEDIKSSPIICGKRKTKVPAELDLSLVAEDMKNGNGKRIRAKSRSAPSTPQGKSDPVFMDQVCASPMLIDCPHPNCNKRYKHINGLRYHQSHAHLESVSKQEFEAESEDRLSDYEDPLSNMSFDSPETPNSTPKKAKSVHKINSLGSAKGRKVLLNNDHGSSVNAKTRRTVANGKDGPIDDLSNLPLISNMSVVLENCLITDRSTSVEMPKLEAEGVIDKRDVCEKLKKENGVAERCSKSRTNRLIVSPPAPPKLIAIPTTPFPNSTSEGPLHQSSPMVALTKAKNLSLKPIKPKLDVIAQVNMANAAIVVSKESKRKERHRLKDRNGKDPRSSKMEPAYVKTEDTKTMGKDFPVSLLKEHLSKQDIPNGPTETQESRMASIRAEADKVYTFTDNAPSPSIGSSARIDSGTHANGDGTKTNSPAYSDISDAADDGGLNSRSRASLAPDLNGSISAKVPSTTVTTTSMKELQSSPINHGYEPYGLQGYMTAGQQHNAAFLKMANPYGRSKEDVKEVNEDMRNTEADTETSTHPQLQLPMTQTQTALAQSLYYGQYTRGVTMDPKAGIVTSAHQQPTEMCCDDLPYNKQRDGQARREVEQRERTKEDMKQMTISPGVISKGTNSVRFSCTKPSVIYVELDKQLPLQQCQGKSSVVNMSKDQELDKESEDFTSEVPNTKAAMDSNPAFVNDSESQSWSRSYQTKYSKQQNQDMNKISEEMTSEKSKDRQLPHEPVSRLEADVQNVKRQDPSLEDIPVERSRADGEETTGDVSEEPQSSRVAVSSSLSPQQSYIQYQHSYPYLHLCETSNNAYRVIPPALVHNYPGFHYPLYGKTAGREEPEASQNSCGMKSKPVNESSALELLQHNNLPYHGKSPVPGERGSPDQDREADRERDSVPFARHLHTHHHTHLGMSYTLVSGQYDPFQGMSSAALVSSQQVSTAQTSSNENDGKM